MKQEFFNEYYETMSPEDLRPIQEERFLRQMDYVWERSPFYQKKFKEHGIEKKDLQSLRDLPRLPFTEKDELRKS
ncbi:MAG: phenylacetate--CoA ligase, partial [Pseudomonadota bacterium]